MAIGRYTLPRPPDLAASIADEVDSLGKDPGSVRLVTSFTPTPARKPRWRARGRSAVARNSHRRPEKRDGPPLRSARLSRGEQIDRWDRSEKCPPRDRRFPDPAQSAREIDLPQHAGRALGGRRTAGRARLRANQWHGFRSPPDGRGRRPLLGGKRCHRRQRLGPANAARPGSRSRLAVGRFFPCRHQSRRPRSAMLQTLPASGHNRQNFYWPIFSRWASSDPVTASQRAAQLPPGSGHDNAVQVVASTWASQDAQAAFAWANGLPPSQSRDNALQTMLSSWANKDPQEAATMIAGLPPGPDARSRHRQHRPAMGAERSARRARLDPGSCRPAKEKVARFRMSSRAGRKAIRTPPPITSPPCRSAKCRTTR